jgi:hypothetical protein
MRPEGGEILRRRKLESAVDSVSGKTFTDRVVSWPAPRENDGRLGRPSALANAELLQRRDQLHGIFAAHWPTIGWNLQRARSLSHIGPALCPLADLQHSTIELLVLKASARALPDGVRVLQPERKRLYKELAEVENRLNAANTSVMEGEDAFGQAQNRFAIARDGYSYARKKSKKSKKRGKKKAQSFLKDRQRWSRLCQRVQAELNRRKESLRKCHSEVSEIRKKITDIEAHFAQTELLQFVLSERYVCTPLNLANAVAGLPHMSWRNSFRLCLRGACSPEASINYLIVEAVRMALERAAPTSADEAVNEIRRQISKGRQFESVREYLGERWPTLEDAVLKGWSSAVHANARPYKITFLFLQALKGRKQVANPLLDALEKDLSNA